MMEEAFRRARRPDQKRQRRVAILAAAAALLDQDGMDGLSLNRIARRVDLAKSNVYRYFESREQILLTLLLEDLRGWSEEVGRRLAPLAGDNRPAAVAEVLATSLSGRPRLCELASALARSLEGKLSNDAIGDFRAGMDAVEAALGTSLRSALPAVPAERMEWLLRAVLALVAGLWPMARICSNAGQAPAGRRWREPRPSFHGDLESSVRALLYGLLVEGWRASGRQVSGT